MTAESVHKVTIRTGLLASTAGGGEGGRLAESLAGVWLFPDHNAKEDGGLYAAASDGAILSIIPVPGTLPDGVTHMLIPNTAFNRKLKEQAFIVHDDSTIEPCDKAGAPTGTKIEINKSITAPPFNTVLPKASKGSWRIISINPAKTAAIAKALGDDKFMMLVPESPSIPVLLVGGEGAAVQMPMECRDRSAVADEFDSIVGDFCASMGAPRTTASLPAKPKATRPGAQPKHEAAPRAPKRQAKVKTQKAVEKKPRATRRDDVVEAVLKKLGHVLSVTENGNGVVTFQSGGVTARAQAFSKAPKTIRDRNLRPELVEGDLLLLVLPEKELPSGEANFATINGVRYGVQACPLGDWRNPKLRTWRKVRDCLSA